MMEEGEVIHGLTDAVIENECRLFMFRNQCELIITRYSNGDLTITEAQIELKNASNLIEIWRLGDPPPFGEIE